MIHFRNLSIPLAAVIFLGAVAGCNTLKETSNTERGAAAGAVLGAVTGAVIAQKTDGSTAKGAIIGAAAGGVIGAAAGHIMDRQAQELKESLPDAQVEPVVDSTGTTVGVHIVFNSALLFDVNRSELRTEVRQSLDTLAASLTRYEETALVVVGHTDSDGTDAYNQALSERRAGAVVNYLRSRGIAEQRMQAIGMGETAPVAPNTTPEGKQRNRRVEIGIVPVVEQG